MRGSLPLGRVLGIPLRVHFTFALLLLWIGWMGWEAEGWRSSLWALAQILALFGCVVLHELAHSLVARRFGVEVSDITLYPIGGVASLKSIPTRPIQEFLIAIAGPLVNLVIFAGLAAWNGSVPAWSEVPDIATGGSDLLHQILLVNIALALFNLIPAFPMDGGRILRSLLAMLLPYPLATRLAVRLGQAIAVLFVAWGIWVDRNPWLPIIGLFIFVSAGREDQATQVRARLRNVKVRDVMIADFESLSPDDTLAACLEAVRRRGQEDFPVIFNGLLSGILTREQWMRALKEEGDDARVGQRMSRGFIVLNPDGDLSEVCPRFTAMGQGFFPVVENGRVVGILKPDDVRRYLAIRELRTPNPRPARGGVRRRSGFSVDLG